MTETLGRPQPSQSDVRLVISRHTSVYAALPLEASATPATPHFPHTRTCAVSSRSLIYPRLRQDQRAYEVQAQMMKLDLRAELEQQKQDILTSLSLEKHRQQAEQRLATSLARLSSLTLSDQDLVCIEGIAKKKTFSGQALQDSGRHSAPTLL